MSRDPKPRDRRPRADQLRAHRQELELARAEGCTVLEARERIEQRKARRHWEATHARLQAKINGQPAPSRQSEPFEQPSGPKPWMHFN